MSNIIKSIANACGRTALVYHLVLPRNIVNYGFYSISIT